MLLNLIYVMVVFGIIVAAGMGYSDYKVSTDSTLKAQITVIDRALATWARHHSNTYPEKLADLQAVEILPKTIDLTPYSYAPTAPIYNLTFTMSDGSTYKSPGSNQ